jgi:membrane associated rhomboid family serine protease
MRKEFKYLIALVGLLYVIHFFNSILGMQLSQWGILPRTIKGLVGILFSPFLHGSWGHLFSNTIPLFVLLFLLKLQIPTKHVFIIILSIVVLGGSLVWLFGRSSVHVGASGVIYGLVSFLVVNGFKSKKFKALLIALVVVFLYGGLIWGVLPTRYYISWEGHLFGALAGAFIAFKFKNVTDSSTQKSN